MYVGYYKEEDGSIVFVPDSDDEEPIRASGLAAEDKARELDGERPAYHGRVVIGDLGEPPPQAEDPEALAATAPAITALPVTADEQHNDAIEMQTPAEPERNSCPTIRIHETRPRVSFS
jgi:hypothetical protein